MRSAPILGLGFMAGMASAAPYKKRQTSANSEVVAYWGQTTENDLSTYCTANSDIDILILSFLDDFIGSATIPYGEFGGECTINSNGSPADASTCDALGQEIATCQAAGIKIILSLGGEATGSYGLSSESEAQAMATYLWQAYGNGGVTTSGVVRPFGSGVFVNGFDFDIEEDTGSQYYQYLVDQLRTSFASDPANTYWITAAPQCPIPDANIGTAIQNSQFDKIWIQYYNQYAACSTGYNGEGPFNWASWESFIVGTPSANAQLYVGLPSSTTASGSANFYLTPSELVTFVQTARSESNFYGIMLWSAGLSGSNINSGCTYAQECKAVLLTGNSCTNGPVSTPSSGSSTPAPTTTKATTTTTTTTKATTSTSAPAATQVSSSGGTVAEWDQCGGAGYTGATQCQSPYTCVYVNSNWSSCQV